MPNEQHLRDRVVVVTGASSGIGRAIATACGRAGAHLALTYATNERGARDTAAAVAAAGARAIVLQWDAREPEHLPAISGRVVEEFGRVDAWVNNAGADVLTGPGAALPPLERLDLLTSVDLRGTIAASWHAVELLEQRGGVIVNMSWDHAVSGMAGVNPQLFAAVKGGVLSFSKALARTTAPRVRVNVVAPGWIATAFGTGLDPRRREAIADSIPLARWGTPDDVAAAVVFLASPAAAYVTGQTLFVGGGAVM